MFVNLLIGIAVISVIMLVHELGHFFAAKSIKVRVDEFGLGFPPRIWAFKKGETEYSINAIPFGGFNKLAGEEDPEVPDGLSARKIPARLLVICAGSLMNILLALVLFSITFMIPQDALMGEVLVGEVAAGSPAEAAGILPGDTILELNGKEINSNYDLSYYTRIYLGNEVTLLIERSDGTTDSVRLAPRWKPPEGEGAMGVTISTINAEIVSVSYPFWQAIPKGFTGLWETVVLYKNGLVGVITGAESADFFGPVGIVQATGEVAQYGAVALLEFAAFISLILGIMNLLPLPALDGGRLAFILIEFVRRGKRISPKYESRVHLIGFALFMILMLAITFQDLIRIFSGESILP